MVKFFEDMFTYFGRIHERDRQTDIHTHRHRMTAEAALMRSIAWQKWHDLARHIAGHCGNNILSACGLV